MEHSEYIQGLLANIVERKDVDYDAEFGHVVREYTVRLPNGSACKGLICNDDYRNISQAEKQRRIDDMWRVAYGIHRRACTNADSSSHVI